jgi:alpha-tubulin suppressor-like RCC1 family protein
MTKAELCQALNQVEPEEYEDEPEEYEDEPEVELEVEPEPELEPEVNVKDRIPFTMDLYLAIEFMLNVDFADIFNLCQTSRLFRRVCQKESFWRARYLQDFGNDALTNLPAHSWKEAYRVRRQVKLHMFTHGDFRDYGQLGIGDDDDDDIYWPVEVESLTNVVQVSCGFNHTGAVTGDGTLYMFGSPGYNGKLGLGISGGTVKIYIPTPIRSLTNVVQVSCGDGHTGVVTSDGKLYMFGSNGNGQLGDGTKDISSVPKEITSLTEVVQVSCGRSYTGVVTGNGRLYMFGQNRYGQLGISTRTESITPVWIKSLTNVVQVSCGHNHTGVVTSDGNGKLYMFGHNGYGQLGDGTGKNSWKPKLPIMTNVVQVSCGPSYTGVITGDGTLYMFGSNGYSQMGIGEVLYTTPVEIPWVDHAVQVSCGMSHTGVVDAEGNAYIVGRGIEPQYGQKAGIRDAVMISCGDNYTAVIAYIPK